MEEKEMESSYTGRASTPLQDLLPLGGLAWPGLPPPGCETIFTVKLAALQI